MRQLFRELKRRNVYKVAVTYAAVAFVTLQAARLIFPATTLEGVYDVLVLVAFVGFPIALVIAWAFELTPEGVRRTSEAAGETDARISMSAEERRAQSRLALKALVGLGLVGAAVVGGWYLLGGGGEPSAESVAAADTAHSEAGVDDRSIAVLPFENMGGAESEQFTEGVHDGLLTRLSNISDLQVISRTSVTQYEGTDKTVSQIARELGTQWVVEGAVQQAGGQVQVNAQLIQAREDAHQWAETYRRELNPENLFAVQSELTEKIARSLEAELNPQEEERVRRRPTENLEAYQLYARGRRLLTRSTGTDTVGVRQALELFRRAIDRDSSFALAWSGIADAASAAEDSTRQVRRRAASRALELDPQLAEAHASMSTVHAIEQDGPAALRALKRAVDLKPSYAVAHGRLGIFQLWFGRPEPAVEHLRLAEELSPRYPSAQFWLVLAELVNGEYQQAHSVLRRAKKLYPDAPAFRGYGGVVLVHLKRWEEVRRRITGLEGADLWNRAYLAVAGMATGDTASARAQLDTLRSGDEPIALALVEAALGNRDAAFSALDRLAEEGYIDPTSMPELRYLFPEHFGPVREDPRYDTIIREFNQAWGLNLDGSLPDSVDVSLDGQADE